MDSTATQVALPAVLAVVMFGLGLSLTADDFRRVRQHRIAVVVALVCQVVLLPAVCFALVEVVDLDPVLAVGMLLLAASPGGTAANLMSHLFRGDVALNVALTGVNSIIAVVSLPIVTNLALAHFQPDIGTDGIGLQLGKAIQVFGFVLVPVVLGLVVRARARSFADAADRPVRILSATVLVLLIVGTAVAERSRIVDYVQDVGAVALVFCVCSLALGYAAPRAFGLPRPQALACAMEIGIHNGALAITIAVAVIGSVELAVAPAVYGVLIFPVAAVFGLIVSRPGRPGDDHHPVERVAAASH